MAEIILPPEENEETPQAPELNIDKPTENSKVISIEFEAKKTNKVSTKDTNQQLYTTDTDAWFEFKETSLEGANGTYSVVFRNSDDGSIFQRTGDVLSGVAYYKIPHQEIRHAGAWRGQIVYRLSNGDTTAREFGYDVKGHILDGKDVQEIVVEDFETLMAQLRSMKDNAEVELANLTQELESTTDIAEQNETDRQAFFDDLVEDIDELQANYQELLDTGVLQTNINTKLEALEEEYAPKLTEVTAQLAQKTDKTFVDSEIERLDQKDVDLTAQLAHKANKSDVGKIADGTPLFADTVSEMTDPARLYVNLSDGYIYAHNSSLDAFESTSILYQATGTNEFPAKNVIKNGDFSEGIAGGWVANASTHSVSNNVLKNIADGTANYGLEQQGILNIPIGHKLYVTARVRVTSAEASYLRLGVNYSSDSAVTLNSPISGKTYNLSGVFQVITNTTPNIRFTHGYDTPITANGKAMELQNVVAIDLTEVFGLGNEPAVSELDAIMNEIPNRYFDGTLAPFVNNKTLYKDNLALKENLDSTISGTPNQIEVSDTKKISIPKNPTLMQPAVSSATFGAELAPTIDKWVGINGSVWNGTEWTIPAKGQLKTPITVESGAEYQIEVVWKTTNDYGVLNIPRLVVSLGTAVSVGQFTGYSDALYKLTLTANETGTVDLILGDGVEDWYATITSISIKKVIKKVTPAGRLGVGSFELTTMGDSIAIGNGLQKRTTGEANTALGLNALRDLTTGLYNVALGTRAMERNQTGLNNVALGHGALRYLQSGYYNIGIGYSAMLNNVVGSWNIAIGNEAMRDLTTGVRNTVVGSRAMNDLTTGNYNVAMGREAGLYPNEVNNSTKTGSNNVFIGYRSGQSHNENTDESTVIGSYATARHRGTAIGRKTKAGGVGSVAIGTDSAGNGATSFEENTFVLGTSNHHVEVPGKLNIAQYTPASSVDIRGKVGDITTDDNFIYVKTTAGWKRNALETW